MPQSKYPKTYHLNWSEGATRDDKIADSIERLLNVPVIISEKCDGGSASIEAYGCFARTHAHPPTHPSFDHLKALHSQIKHLIPEKIQIFGENLYALHSIAYDKLPAYFLIFNVRDLEANQWLSWDMVELWANELNIPTVPVLFRGIVKNHKELQELTTTLAKAPSELGTVREGIVIRVAEAFADEDFDKCVMKMVRKDHVNTDIHWKYQAIIKNKLRENND
jgi:RNA ligase